MFTELLHRLLHPAERSGGSRRTEVYPPALLQRSALSVAGWRAELRDWLGSGWNPLSHGLPDRARRQAAHNSAGNPGLCSVRDEFLQALEDIRTQQVGMLQARIRIARSLRELWHVRPEVFKVVALHYSQAEAQCRLDRLNRHFPTRSPRSGFGSLEPQPADSRPTARH